MRVLIGEYPSQKVRRISEANGWGEMYIYKPPRTENFRRSGFDNGAYLDWRNGRQFDERRYLKALDVAAEVGGPPYMAVCPDLVGQGNRSLDFSFRWMCRQSLPETWNWYLALQDGMSVSDVSSMLSLFRGLFLGGTDEFKGTAQMWCDFAHKNGKLFHYARAGTERKIRHAINVGADSLDSSFPLWTMDRLFRMEWLVNVGEPRLEFS